MTQTVQLPLWLFVLILLFAAVTALSHLLLPSVRWFFRRRLERAVRRLNKRLARPIEPFKLARRHDMIQRLIYDPEVTREIVNYVEENAVPENVAFQKAQEYAREIVPSFSAFAYFSFGIRLARLLANAVYTVRTGPRNDEVIAGLPPDATVVFIMNHRSNMDYLLVTYLAARASALSYAVGEWARVWPLSRLIKSMGAYFIRRKSRGALYRKVLARYVQMATAGGVAQAIFPEGGLSLDGKLASPKMGLLAYVVEGHDPERRDVVFVPVAINYDRILEDLVLVAAGKRGDRRFGARITVVTGFILRRFWQAVRGRYKRFGSAAVVFGDPLSLQAFGHKRPVEELAQNLMQRIKDAMPALSVPLLAQVFLDAPGAISKSHALQSVRDLADRIGPNALLGTGDDLNTDLENAFEQLEKRDMIVTVGNVWKIAENKRDVLVFYANSVAPHFSRLAASAE